MTINQVISALPQLSFYRMSFYGILCKAGRKDLADELDNWLGSIPSGENLETIVEVLRAAIYNSTQGVTQEKQHLNGSQPKNEAQQNRNGSVNSVHPSGLLVGLTVSHAFTPPPNGANGVVSHMLDETVQERGRKGGIQPNSDFTAATIAGADWPNWTIQKLVAHLKEKQIEHATTLIRGLYALGGGSPHAKRKRRRGNPPASLTLTEVVQRLIEQPYNVRDLLVGPARLGPSLLPEVLNFFACDPQIHRIIQLQQKWEEMERPSLETVTVVDICGEEWDSYHLVDVMAFLGTYYSANNRLYLSGLRKIRAQTELATLRQVANRLAKHPSYSITPMERKALHQLFGGGSITG